MELGDAVNITRKMMHQIKAFEKLDGVLKLALNAERFEVDARERLKELEKEIDKDREDFEAIKKVRGSEIFKLVEEIRSLKEDVTTKISWKQKTISKIDLDVSDHEDRAKKIRKDYDEEDKKKISFLEGRKKRLEKEVSDLQKLLDGMIIKVDSVRSQIKGGD